MDAIPEVFVGLLYANGVIIPIIRLNIHPEFKMHYAIEIAEYSERYLHTRSYCRVFTVLVNHDAFIETIES